MDKKKITAVEYTKSTNHLPKILKDFHDQKDLFKAMHRLYANNEGLKSMPNTWVDNHVFTIDYFLWFMGQHGYTLQKSRADVEFFDINKTISDFKKKEVEQFAEIFKIP